MATTETEFSVSDIKAVIPPEPKESESGESGSIVSKLAVFLVILALIVSVIAIIIAATSLAQKGKPTVVVNAIDGTPASTSEEIWTFAIGHDGTNIEYIDDVSGKLRGFHVDIINAVCKQANKRCELVWDIYENCWNSMAGQSPRGGVGLMAGWYDACTGWFNTYERALTVQFSAQFRLGLKGTFYVRRGNPSSFSPTNIRSTEKIGFIDGWASDEHCLSRNSDTINGVPLSASQVVDYGTRDELKAALNNGAVVAAFANTNVYADDNTVETIGDQVTNCFLGGGSMMSRKDSTLNTWWNDAFEGIRNSGRYEQICDQVATDHGHQPGATGDLLCV